MGSLDLERSLGKADENLRVIHGAKNRAYKEKQLGVDQDPPGGDRADEETREIDGLGPGQAWSSCPGGDYELRFLFFFPCLICHLSLKPTVGGWSLASHFTDRKLRLGVPNKLKNNNNKSLASRLQQHGWTLRPLC